MGKEWINWRCGEQRRHERSGKQYPTNFLPLTNRVSFIFFFFLNGDPSMIDRRCCDRRRLLLSSSKYRVVNDAKQIFDRNCQRRNVAINYFWTKTYTCSAICVACENLYRFLFSNWGEKKKNKKKKGKRYDTMRVMPTLIITLKNSWMINEFAPLFSPPPPLPLLHLRVITR